MPSCSTSSPSTGINGDSRPARQAEGDMPAGLALQGGGLFTMFPVTLKSSVIAQNVPDQCHGC